MKEHDDLIRRLRGIYTVPVNDGAGLLNGKASFTRAFETPPISHEAADAIEWLVADQGELIKEIEMLTGMLTPP
ncbi:MAG: hypothetical protein V3V47_01870 [Desulfobacteria bacterium]